MKPVAVVRSPQNARVRAAAALSRRKIRAGVGRYLVEGPRCVDELLPTGDLDEVFVVPGRADDVAEAARRAGVRVTLVDEDVLARLAPSVTPQGVVAVARQRPARLEDVVGAGHLIVLAGVSDPGNAGTAIRTAGASGAAGVVLTTGSVDPWNPKAVRASAGAVGRLPVVAGVAVAQVLQACRSVGQRCVALDAAGTVGIDAPRVLAPPVALLFGNESHGLDAVTLDAVDAVVAIPLYGPVGSLNLAAAV
ncbi:MAG TPA: RNA methyltransferase, partial [Nitriliruptorales bacterium]|nr:RNA methyltransferase [Nitriliruptorales bacterium]